MLGAREPSCSARKLFDDHGRKDIMNTSKVRIDQLSRSSFLVLRIVESWGAEWGEMQR